MTIAQAKQIKIEDYLQSINILPVRIVGNSIWYNSPFREEKKASFKINQELQVFHDFGDDTKGDIIKLAMLLNDTESVSLALKYIEEKLPQIKTHSFSFRQQKSQDGFEDITIKPLTNIALIQYLNSRMISTELAQHYCNEVYYKYKNKSLFAIAFPSVTGLEVFNKYIKTNMLGPKSISIIDNQKKTCCVFEGAIDFMSYISLQYQNIAIRNLEHENDYYILNSTSNTKQLLEMLDKYEKILCYLDNDDSGIQSTVKIRGMYSLKVEDKSVLYKDYNDLNDMLCDKKIITENASSPPKVINPVIDQRTL